MHKVADAVKAEVSIPLIHIADATAEALSIEGHSKVGLLGTAFTMEQSFYKGRLRNYGLEVVVPNQQQRNLIHNVIYQELCLGKIESDSKKAYLEVVDRFSQNGVSAVILGCTEIGLLIQQEDTSMKLYDTTEIHSQATIEFILS